MDVSYAHSPERPEGIADVSLVIPAGMLVAFVGPNGSGKTTLAELILGLLEPDAGRIEVDGVAVQGLSLPERIRRGLTLIPEDRQGAGIVPPLSVTQNVTLSSLREHTRVLWLVGTQERATVERLSRELDIRMADPDRPVDGQVVDG